MRTKPIDIINATRTIDNYSVEDAKGVLIQLLNSHPAIVTRIVNTNSKTCHPLVNVDKEIVHSPEPIHEGLYKVVIRKINSKIHAIKMVRAMTGAGLKEAKEFIEGISRIEDAGKNLLPFGVIAQDKTHMCATGIMEDAINEENCGSAAGGRDGVVILDVIPQDAPYKYSF
jgi:hypothetical protein